jgi:hypothetical protein
MIGEVLCTFLFIFPFQNNSRRTALFCPSCSVSASFLVLLFLCEVLVLLVALSMSDTAYAFKSSCGKSVHQSMPSSTDSAATARWIVAGLETGVLNTISSREGNHGAPFGNPYSFVDGPCSLSTGIPYFYATEKDQSLIDVAAAGGNDVVSLSLSEAFMSGDEYLEQKNCVVGSAGDPESPMCARLVVTGRWEEVDDKEENEMMTNAFTDRHPLSASWPAGHGFKLYKIVVQDLWLISHYGGAVIIDVDEYFAYEPVWNQIAIKNELGEHHARKDEPCPYLEKISKNKKALRSGKPKEGTMEMK